MRMQIALCFQCGYAVLHYSQWKVISIHHALLISIFLACCACADRGYKKLISAVS